MMQTIPRCALAWLRAWSRLVLLLPLLGMGERAAVPPSDTVDLEALMASEVCRGVASHRKAATADLREGNK